MTTDYKAIGKGIYGMLDEENRAVVAFGMIPKDMIDLATKCYKEKVARLALERYGIEEDQEMLEMFIKAVKPEAVREFEHEVSLAILGAAKDNNALLV